MRTATTLLESLRNFDEEEIRIYHRFATEWRDQRLTEGSSAEVAFWNSLVTLCVEERKRRAAEVRRLETMYQTGMDPDQTIPPSQKPAQR